MSDLATFLVEEQLFTLSAIIYPVGDTNTKQNLYVISILSLLHAYAIQIK